MWGCTISVFLNFFRKLLPKYQNNEVKLIHKAGHIELYEKPKETFSEIYHTTISSLTCNRKSFIMFIYNQ